MKNAILATGAALVLAVLLSSPTFAQTANPSRDTPPTPAAAPAADAPIDALIETATTPEDRIALLRRCAGPPPRPMPAKEVAAARPAAEPAVLAQ